MKKQLSLLTLSALFALHISATSAQDYLIPEATPAHIVSGIHAADRTAEQVGRDPARRPAEMLTLSGIAPGDVVVEFAGAGQYYTGILSPAVGPNGAVHMFDLPYTEERNGEASRAFVAAHPNTTYTIVDYNDIVLPANVDVVMNMLYYHDLSLNAIDVAVLNRKIFAALKPGGVFIIEDHNAAPGSGRRDTMALHRIDPELIKQEVLAAGFVLTAESNLLANPDDDHTKMVFTPGTRGVTDRSVFVFEKPESGVRTF